ncbi:MAG: hypothetical protein K2J92_02990 [Muribaculaceae bacterium]|nr:hypothetical protein [Muribaculaceae bacterium]
MTIVDIPLNLSKTGQNSSQQEILNEVANYRNTTQTLINEERYMDALERTVSALRNLRDFNDTDNTEFLAVLAGLIFDLAEIHFALHDYRQSEKELEVLFKVLARLIKEDAERFGKYHILAMELSTRILRSRKKAMELLVKQQLNASALYEKVNSGVVAATDKLVDSLRNVGQLLASAGDYKAAMKFYAEAIKFSKKRTGRINRKEIKMTIEMAEIMMRVRTMRPRAKRLLNAILPHTIALETIELEEDILALLEVIDNDISQEPKWKTFIHKVTTSTMNRFKKGDKNAENKENEGEEEGEEAAVPTDTENQPQPAAEETPVPEKVSEEENKKPASKEKKNKKNKKNRKNGNNN